MNPNSRLGAPNSLIRWLDTHTTALETKPREVRALIKAYREFREISIEFRSDKAYEKLAKQYQIFPGE